MINKELKEALQNNKFEYKYNTFINNDYKITRLIATKKEKLIDANKTNKTK